MAIEKIENNFEYHSEYLCQKCKRFFLEKDFDLRKCLCKNCRDKQKSEGLENGGSKSNLKVSF